MERIASAVALEGLDRRQLEGRVSKAENSRANQGFGSRSFEMDSWRFDYG
jgi:hypothetical protein